MVLPDAVSACRCAARCIAETVRDHPSAVLGLATGRTMEPVYEELHAAYARGGLDFSRARTFNLDEYVGLPGTDPHSYRHYMNRHLFSRVNIDLRHTHLPDGAATDLGAECAAYERRILESGGIDLQLLGIGRNGHLGFNEPMSSFDSRTRVVALAPETRMQNAELFGGLEKMPAFAITMGLGTILNSRRCLLLATGFAKAAIVSRAVEGPVTTAVPGTSLQMHPRCVVILDRAAARDLRSTGASSAI